MSSVPGDDRTDVLVALAELARHFAEAPTLDETLHRIVERSEEYLPGCDGVSMMMVQPKRRIVTPASSSEVAYRSDLAQYEADEGPCLEALREHHTIVIDDLEHDDRWPAYRERALVLGVRSMLSLRLFMAEDTLGALNLYSRQPHTFGTEARALGQVLAALAAVAMKAAIEESGLQEALRSRDVIGQAKGMLMERQGLDGREAFERLRGLSGARGMRIRDLAARMVETGEIPD